ncbi:MAG: G5 domain-containing protein [Candidatus Ancillula sp.]|jgi:hypothetical protein|nr:G5 domain-containing protein [Candidatus Ancillula sp.]
MRSPFKRDLNGKLILNRTSKPRPNKPKSSRHKHSASKKPGKSDMLSARNDAQNKRSLRENSHLTHDGRQDNVSGGLTSDDLSRAVFFSPNLIQGQQVSTDQVSKFQSKYVQNVASLNLKNADDYTRLPFEAKEKVSEFDMLFDDRGWNFRNACKGLICLLMVVVLVVGVYIPFNLPSVILALGQEASTRGFSVSSKFGTETNGDVQLEVHRENPHYAQNVSLTVRGEEQVFTTTRATVKDVLAEQAVTVGFGEGVYPDLDQVVSDGEKIVVDLITTQTETIPREVPFAEQRIEDGAMRKGEEQLVQAGQVGQSSSTFIVKLVGGNQVSRDLFSEIHLSAPQDQVVKFGTATPVNNGTIVTVPSEDVKKFAYDQVMATWGDPNEFQCLDHLWQRESGWRTHAGNVISGAYGIPQALPGSKMAQFGEDWRDNPITQVKWGLSYITGRYRTPCGAWSKSQSSGWY